MKRTEQKIRRMQRKNAHATGYTQGTGKTLTVICNGLTPDVEAGDTAVIYADPDGSGGEVFAGHVLERGHGHRLIVMDLNRNDFASPGLVFKSNNPDYFVRQRENRSFARLMGQILTMNRDETLDQTRLTKEMTMYAIELWQYQDRDTPPEEILNALRPGTTGFDALVAHNTHEPADAKAQMVRALARSPRLFDIIGAATRLLEESLNEPILLAMLAPTFDLEQALLLKKIIVVMGCQEDFINRFVIKVLLERCSQIVHRNWLRTRTPLPVRRYVDESKTVISEREAVWAGRNTKKGETTVLISQTADFGDPVVNDLIEENFPLKYLFACISQQNAERNAHHMKFRLDAMKELFATKRQVHTGDRFEWLADDRVEIGEYGIPTNRKGYKQVLRPQYEETDVPHLQALGDQGIENQILSMRLGLGECFIRDGSQLTGPVYLPKLPTPFVYDGLARQFIDQHLEWQPAQGISRKPTVRTWNNRLNTNGTNNGRPKGTNGTAKNGTAKRKGMS